MNAGGGRLPRRTHKAVEPEETPPTEALPRKIVDGAHDPTQAVRFDDHYVIPGDRDALGSPAKHMYREEREAQIPPLEKKVALLNQRIKTVEQTGRDPRVKGWRGEAESALPRLKNDLDQVQALLDSTTRLRDRAVSRIVEQQPEAPITKEEAIRRGIPYGSPEFPAEVTGVNLTREQQVRANAAKQARTEEMKQTHNAQVQADFEARSQSPKAIVESPSTIEPKAQELLQRRGFTPEQIRDITPEQANEILQKRAGEAGAGPGS